MIRKKKFIRKPSKFERRHQKVPELGKIWGETPDISLRPEKYLDYGLSRLNPSQNLRKEIKRIFYFLQPHFSGLRGYSDPLPELAGIIKFVYKSAEIKLGRQELADVFGINKDMVTKCCHEISSYMITDMLIQSKSIVKCPKCYGKLKHSGCFWSCVSCTFSQYSYQLRKEFLQINRHLLFN